jgi:hypothetical protein
LGSRATGRSASFVGIHAKLPSLQQQAGSQAERAVGAHTQGGGPKRGGHVAPPSGASPLHTACVARLPICIPGLLPCPRPRVSKLSAGLLLCPAGGSLWRCSPRARHLCCLPPTTPCGPSWTQSWRWPTAWVSRTAAAPPSFRDNAHQLLLLVARTPRQVGLVGRGGSLFGAPLPGDLFLQHRRAAVAAASIFPPSPPTSLR